MNTERIALRERVRQVTPQDFEEVALAVFRYQARENAVYRQFLEVLNVRPERVTTLSAVPHLPIALFKALPIQSGDWQPVATFASSGTTGQVRSQHLVRDLDWYLEGARRGFEAQYGKLEGRCILALLPSYLEQQQSSLVAMVRDFIAASAHPRSGFYLYDHNELIAHIDAIRREEPHTPILLIGVSFALWDLADTVGQKDWQGITVMETGGMKGRRQELTRPELHRILTRAFGVSVIHSEYGMTELLSQGYSTGAGLFQPIHTLRVRVREYNDPLADQAAGKAGVIHLTDLANIDTISFIATEDIGIVHEDGSFEVLGRLDISDLRGCNLMVAQG